MKKDTFIIVISRLVMLAAITKRAQIPFSSWLPAAIAAPTPVSSLVHSSTLVTAGVYLLIRFFNSLPTFILDILLFLSLFTIFMSGLGANFEFDLKKIIALSTLSQLGLIIRILALGRIDLAFFHLLTHALFKALLFICAGVIIHRIGNCQDIRFMGSLIFLIPLTCTFFTICNFSLCGLPFLSGFYSKDLIIELIRIKFINIFIYFIFYVSVGLTVRYSVRLSYYLIFGRFRFLRLNSLKEDNSDLIIKRMGGLILFVIFRGRLLIWVLFPTPAFVCLPRVIKILTLLIIILGGVLGLELAKRKINYDLKSKKKLE